MIQIGVTGHRAITELKVIQQAVKSSLQQILDSNPSRKMIFYSSLAEGADQIAAQTALKFPNCELFVPLPFSTELYLETFSSTTAVNLFHNLVNRAAKKITVPPTATRQDAYFEAGMYIVQNCDVLIAIWNGEEALGKGGTGDIVRETLKLHKKVYWIFSRNHKPETENKLADQKSIGEITIL